jgi:hypothetical protein
LKEGKGGTATASTQVAALSALIEHQPKKKAFFQTERVIRLNEPGRRFAGLGFLILAGII